MAKKPKSKNKIPSKVWTKYKVEGDKLSREKYCPRCGPSSFLAQHKDRETCGKCGYVIIRGEPEVKETPKEEKVEVKKS